MTAKRIREKRGALNVSDLGNLIRSITSAIASAQVSQKPILKRLLYILGHVSLARYKNWENYDAAEEVELINFSDVLYLSDVLFPELNRSFENLFSTLSKHDAESFSTFASGEENIELATLFLRCCLKLVTLLLCKPEVALEKAKNLLSIFTGLIRAMNGDSSIVITLDGPLDLRYTFLCTWLEIFIDEILVNDSMRALFFRVNSAFSSCTLFSKHDSAGVVEMLSAHFTISTSDEKMNQMCLERLYWNHAHVFRTPQINLCAAASLLLNPLILSAPKMIHAYVVLLVSDAIGICAPVKGLDLQLIDRYIDAFEKSVVLYTRHICKSENAASGKLGVSRSNSRVAFEHLVLPSTLAKVNDVKLKLKDSWGSYQSTSAKSENGELVAYSVAYAKESLCLFDSSCSENILAVALSILGCVILRASSDDVVDTVLQRYNISGFEDLYLLAATLKLMSCSMLQAIRVLRNWHQSEATGDVRDCKEYKSMMDVVQRFEKLCVHLPGHIPLGDRMESHPHKRLKSEWMLMHFSGLLSVSFALKLDFLVKDSILGMVVSLNLFILEGGDLEALGNSICHSENPSSSLPSSGFKELAASVKAEESCRRLSGAVALKFHKTRTLYLGKLSDDKDPENGSDTGVGVEEESRNGERYLWCTDGMRSSDVEELADFIVCEPGKDYSAWLKGRERFRKQQSGKFGLHMWNKKLKAWRENIRK